MENHVTRRNFLNSLSVTAGAAAAATIVPATYFAGPRPAHAAIKAKGNVPDKPFKTGHITFLTGPANLLGEPGRKGHLMAAEEINAEGGFLGKRKIETIIADEAAGTDANVKELRRMKLSEKIDLFTGIISSGNTPALGPVAVPAATIEGLGGQTDILLSVRPQAIQLHRARPANLGPYWWIDGVIRARTYLGELWDYLVVPGSAGTPLRVSAPPRTVLEVGSRVVMQIDPAQVACIHPNNP